VPFGCCAWPPRTFICSTFRFPWFDPELRASSASAEGSTGFTDVSGCSAEVLSFSLRDTGAERCTEPPENSSFERTLEADERAMQTPP
jgi:hypothetical protein